MVHCQSLSLVMAARMIAGYAALVDAIWASCVVAIAKQIYCYGTISETICLTMRSSIYDANISTSASLISTLVIRFVVKTRCFGIAQTVL